MTQEPSLALCDYLERWNGVEREAQQGGVIYICIIMTYSC